MEKTFRMTRTPLHEQIRDHLQDLIRSGQYERGSALPPERELAAQLGVSRHSLRQAVASLEAVGVVETRHGSGVYLTEQLPDEVVIRFADALFNVTRSIADAVEVRLAFEPFIARRAADLCTANSTDLLAASIDVAPQEGKPAGTVGEPLTFHHQLARMSGNPIFEGLLRSVSTGPTNITLLAKHMPNSAQLWRDEHIAIFKAVTAGNGARAERLMAAHLAAMIPAAREVDARKADVRKKKT